MNTSPYVTKVLATGVSSFQSVPFWSYKIFLLQLIIGYKYFHRLNQSCGFLHLTELKDGEMVLSRPLECFSCLLDLLFLIIHLIQHYVISVN